MTEDQIIEENELLILKIVRGFSPRNETEFTEYLQHGRMGFLKAIRKHNPNRGRLSTIAWWTIRTEILQYINRRKRQEKHIHHNAFGEWCREKVNLDFEPEQSPNSQCEQLDDILPSNLSDTEEKVIRMRGQGHTYQEIGTECGFSPCTAKKRLDSAIKKVRKANKESKINADEF